MSLVIHELATNAIKFGALSQPQSRLRVVWWFIGAAAGLRARCCLKMTNPLLLARLSLFVARHILAGAHCAALKVNELELLYDDADFL